MIKKEFSQVAKILRINLVLLAINLLQIALQRNDRKKNTPEKTQNLRENSKWKERIVQNKIEYLKAKCPWLATKDDNKNLDNKIGN